jgi:hypothetical protein
LSQVDDMTTIAKFYDLHIGQAALKAVQAWLRTASRTNLMSYGEAAAKQGKLAPVKLAELQDMLNTCRRAADSRFAPAWNILQKRGRCHTAPVFARILLGLCLYGAVIDKNPR